MNACWKGAIFLERNVLAYLEETAKRVPNKVAFSDEKACLTFAQLQAQAQAVGTALLRDGFYGQPIVVFMQKQAKTVAAFLGALFGLLLCANG